VRKEHHGFDWFIFVMLLVFVGFSYTLFEQQRQMVTIDQDYAAAAQRLAQAQVVNDALRQEKMDLNDPAYIERIAREELGLAMPGEMPYIPAKK
jgi:cell division protein DivIC